MADLRLFKDRARTIRMVVLDDAGDPADITGATITCQGRSEGGSPVLLWTGTATITDAPVGRFDLAITATIESVGRWDLFIAGVADIDPGAAAQGGTFSVRPSVTEP